MAAMRTLRRSAAVSPEHSLVDEIKLSEVLSEFARTVITDFPIQAILDHLVERIVQVLPVTSAGVTLITPGNAPHYVAASDDAALRFEKLQSELGEGPCLTAYTTGHAVHIPDLPDDARYRAFGPAAADAGLVAVFAFPLRHGDGRLGALDLYRNTSGGLDAHEAAAAQTLADVAAAYLLNAQARDDARATTEQFQHSALHDPLTGLPNRVLLQERLEHAAQRAKRSHSGTAVLFIDVDRFKDVNDTHGHVMGDDLLLHVARRLSGLVRGGDTLARFSGDEFVFLCEDLHGRRDMDVLGARMVEALARPFFIAGAELRVTASVGMAYAGRAQDISARLVVKADAAMYQVKRRGGNGHEILDARKSLEIDESTSFENELRIALVRDELAVAYQPIVRSADGLVTGVEALVRWAHPARGAVPAKSIVGVAEQSGLIGQIGEWVLRRTCRDHAGWMRQGNAAPVDIAVNVSARQLAAQGFCSVVENVLSSTDTDPAVLILEITESIFLEDNQRTTRALCDLRALGVRLALDDFGTGYSSLSYLSRLPIDLVKIDRAFVADLGSAPGRAIVEAVTNLAHVLGLTVVAEGVETEQQRDDVGAIGCDLSQGFFFAEPMDAESVSSQLAGRSAEGVHLPRPPRSLASVT
jgi:diguanylate cyclase (GGDEF)-like protein